MAPETIQLLKDIAPYAAIITAVVSATIAYRSQLRLKAFEMLIARREQVLGRVEETIKQLQEIRISPTTESLRSFSATCFHDLIILNQQIAGCNFGAMVDVLRATYFQVGQELVVGKLVTEEELRGVVTRMVNGLAALYGMAHSEITSELERIALTPTARLTRYLKRRLFPEIPRKKAG